MAHVIFVHGAWVGPDSWDRVAPLVEQAGHTTEAVALPLTSVANDVAIATEAIERAGTDVILVGHSYGGTVITAAGVGQAQVQHLVYVAAVAADQGESANNLVARFPTTPAGPYIQVDGQSRMTIQRDRFPDLFAQDVDAAVAADLAQRQHPTSTACFGDALAVVPAWRDHPTTFLISTEDRVVSPLLQAWEAGRMGAMTLPLASSHASPVSHPREIADAITAIRSR